MTVEEVGTGVIVTGSEGAGVVVIYICCGTCQPFRILLSVRICVSNVPTKSINTKNAAIPITKGREIISLSQIGQLCIHHHIQMSPIGYTKRSSKMTMTVRVSYESSDSYAFVREAGGTFRAVVLVDLLALGITIVLHLRYFLSRDLGL